MNNNRLSSNVPSSLFQPLSQDLYGSLTDAPTPVSATATATATATGTATGTATATATLAHPLHTLRKDRQNLNLLTDFESLPAGGAEPAYYVERSTIELNIEIENNYNLLLKKVREFLSKPSNFEVYPNGKIFIKSEQKF